MAADIDVIDLNQPPDHGTGSTVRSPRPRWPVVVIAVVLGAAIVGRLAGDSTSGDTTSGDATSEAAPARSEAASRATGGPADPDGAPATAPPRASELTFDPVPGETVGRLTVATGGDTVRMWSVDLGRGRAHEIALPVVSAAPIADMRLFGADRAVALLEDGGYVTFDVDESGIALDAIVDLGSRTSLGLAALTPDGSAAWVGIPAGLIRWRLDDDAVDQRWIDALGDHIRLPTVKGVVDQGLVVEAAGRTFIVSGEAAEPLDIDGEVVATAGDWVVVRRCDATLRCGQLRVEHLVSSIAVDLPSDRYFRDGCGLAAPGDDGSVHLVLHRLANIALVSVAPDGTMTTTDIRPIGLACVGAVDTGAGVLVAHDRGLSMVRDGEHLPIDLELGQILAVGGT